MEPRVLLVEDNSNDVLLIKRAFAQVHPQVRLDVLSNGEEAVEYLSGQGKFSDRKKHPLPDLILLDLKIPRKSGLEVLAWIWDQDSLQRLRVIVLTSSECGRDMEKAYNLRAESYLVKPNSFQDLLVLAKRIDVNLLQSSRRRREAGSPAAISAP